MDEFDKMFGTPEANESDEFSKMFGEVNTPISNATIPDRTLGSNLKDVGISVAKGVIGAGQGIVGLADLPTGGRVGRGLETIGIKPKEWQKDLSEEYSLAQQAANKNVDSAKGFVNTAQAMLENPSTIAHSIIETLPSVAAGGVIGRGALAVGSKLAPQAITALGKTGSAIAAGAVGEGAIGAGQTAEEIRGNTTDGLLTAEQAGLAALSGVGTAAFGLVGGRLAKKLGFADVDTMIVSGLNPAKKEGFKGVAKSIIGGGITEGVFEELPQTVQETIFTNAALDKPLLEGVPEGAAKAIILGGAMGSGANLLPGTNVGPVKTPEELDIENRANNMLALDKDQLATGTKRLADELQINKDLLANPLKLDEKARAENIDPNELTAKLVYDNKKNQALLDKVNAEVKAKEELTKKKDAEEYAKLSPEEKVIKDVENKLIVQRETEALKINKRLDEIDRIETIFGKAYSKEADPEKKKQMADRVFSLRKEKNVLLDKQKQEQQIDNEIKAFDKQIAEAKKQYKEEKDLKKKEDILANVFELSKNRNDLLVQKTPQGAKEFAPYTTREERQKALEETLGTANRYFPSDKTAAESAQVIESEIVPKTLADYANQIINAKANQRADQREVARTPEQERNLRQIEDYVNYVQTYINDRFTPEERSVIENYWQGVKKELALRNEEMTPGTEAFMRKKFFETKLNEIEGNVKQDTNVNNDVTKNVVPSLAEQYKRQAWFQQIAKDLGDLPVTNSQDVQTEIPRNLPGGIRSAFTGEPTVEQFDALEEDNSANAWYSALEQAVTGFQQKQATPDQWKGMIKNYPGIKQEELDWIGLNEWLDKQNGKVSKDSLMNFIQENNVQLEEVILGDTADLNSRKGKIKALTDIYSPQEFDFFNSMTDSELDAEIEKEGIDYDVKETQYENMALPGGKNYKEIVLTLPTKEKQLSEEDMAIAFLKSKNIPFDINEDDVVELAAENYDDYFDSSFNPYGGNSYIHDHWPNIINPIAHIRFDERTDAQGNKVLFINEIQSDWHQEGKMQGYATTEQYDKIKAFAAEYGITIRTGPKEELPVKEQVLLKRAAENTIGLDLITDMIDAHKAEIQYAIPDAPFKKSWDLLTMKRMVRYAAENGFDKIAWSSTPEQVAQIENWGPIETRQTELGTSYFIHGNKNVSSIVHRYITDLPRMLNNEFNKGKWGNAKVEQTDVGLQKDGKVTKEEALKAYDNDEMVFLGTEVTGIRSEIIQYQGNDITIVMPDKVLSLPITERMKAKALNEGMPMFELSNGQTYNPSATTKQETNLGNILSQVKEAEGLTGQLGKFLSDFIPESKLDIKVVIDPSTKSAKYVGGNVNTITLRDPSQLNTSLHELTHAVTAREMKANPEITAQVKLLMERVKLKAAKEALLTPAQISLLETQNTSRGYKENISGNLRFENVAYGLLNENEFLAQAMGNAQFQELLKSTTIADKGVMRNAWDAFVELVMKALGIKDVNKNAFGETLSIIAKLAQQENVDQTGQMVNEELAIEQRLPQSEYDAVYAEKNNRLSEFVQNAGIKYHEIKLLADKAFGAISTRLKNVDPELSEHLRWLDFKTSQKIIDVLRTAKPLLEVTKIMSPVDKSEWNWARLNSDTGKIERIESKYGLTDQVKLLREKLDQIRLDAIEVGYDVGFIEDYWPRVIKDTEGFLQATQGISQRAEFTEAIRDKAKELGITQKQFEREYPELKADIISNMILGRYYGIGGPGNIKARVFENIPPEYAKFYMDADASLMQYVYSMTKKIEARRFFGKVPERISNLKSDRNRKQAELEKFKQLAEMARADNPEAFADYQERITQLNEDLVRIEEPLNVYKHQNDYTENIGAYIDEMRTTGRIQPKDEKTVKDILMARFNEQGTHGVVNTFKNAAYIDVMANPISAITQLGDLAWAMYVGKVWTPSGFLGTGKNLLKAISGSFDATKDRFGKSEVTKEDLGFERIAQEFADGTTLGKAVSKAFKIVQLERIDSIGKEVLINNALDQYRLEAKNPEALAKKIRPIFGSKSLDVVGEILADVPSDNVKMLLYSKVLDFQPAALSEMPEFYLKAGNGRVFYMLKTYGLKQLDVFRREVAQNLKSKDPKQKIQGLTNMFQLLALLTLANAGADEIKDYMLGKETRFADNVIDNLLVMGGASRYTQMQISKEGFGSAMLQQILPPMKFINSASKDLNESYKNYVSGDTSSFDHARIVDSLPIVGKLYYWHYGRGEENKKSLAEKDFSEATKAADLFKKQLENSTDKRTFIEANLDRFKQMKLQENFQAALNRNKAVINKLEKLPSTENVQMRLGQLKNQRELILKKYLDVAKTIQ